MSGNDARDNAVEHDYWRLAGDLSNPPGRLSNRDVKARIALAKEVTRGLRVGVIHGTLSDEDATYLETTPESDWSTTALLDSLRRLDALPARLDPCHDRFLEVARLQDVLVPNCHGSLGEDGTLQGALRYLDVPFAFSDVKASAVGIDKLLTKHVMKGLGLRTPDFVEAGESNRPHHLPSPFMPKPIRGGSSIGISLHDECTAPGQFRTDQPDAPLSSKSFCEAFIVGRSVTQPLLSLGGSRHLLPPIEAVTNRPFHDKLAKLVGTSEGDTTFRVPVDLPQTCLLEMANASTRLFDYLRCAGAIRVDFVVDDANRPWALEVNTIPGMHPQSQLPTSARIQGIGYDELVALLVLDAIDTHGQRDIPWGAK